ncbi:hypothetical protein ACFP81_01175 [Deinococcus lacus]|uniref:Uncharacterized protein n=1 Tax=Deinococcus lacus TaxID=392561 RepID=A0ABW1Y9C9_9DEIO
MTNSSKSKRQGRQGRASGTPGSRAQGRGGDPRRRAPARGPAGQTGAANTQGATKRPRTAPAKRSGTERLAEGETFQRSSTRQAPPKLSRPRGGLPELKKVQLEAPPETAAFRDRDGESHVFADSKLRRIAAQILTERGKQWRFRPFSFPLFTDKGHEQTLHFDFYIYDAEDTVIRLILVVPHESREVWDKVGRFKRQYPMYPYELWTPEKLAQLQKPRTRLGF